MDLIETLDKLIRSAGYRTRSVEGELYFEDETILGLAVVYGSAQDLVDSWGGAFETFLRRNAAALRSDRSKCWNVYSVFVTTEPAPARLGEELQMIEQDFQATRKIARAGLRTPQHVRRALAPILPLPSTTAAAAASPERLLEEKLDAAELEFLGRLRSEAVKDTEITEWLLNEG